MDEGGLEVEHQVLLLSSKSGAELPPEVCVLHNISKKEAWRRLIFSIILSLVGFGLFFALLWFSLSRWWRLFCSIFFWSSAFTGLQALMRTCVALAVKNKIDFGDGEFTLTNSDARKAIHKKAFNIIIGSIVYTTLCTSFILSFPEWKIY